jgi:acyl-CoA thioesterase-2
VAPSETLLHALDLSPVGAGRFIATHDDPGDRVVFGGQLVGQMIVAAARTVVDLEVLSISAVFSRGVLPDATAEITADVTTRTTSFATCVVSVSQHDRTCVTAVVLLHHPDDQLIGRQPTPSAVPGPESLPRAESSASPWDHRIVDAVGLFERGQAGPPELRVWSRFAVPDDLESAMQQALVAYATDGFLIGAALRPYPDLCMADTHVTISTTVLAHSISFHGVARAAHWHLLDQHSDFAGRGRSHGRGCVYDSDGRLVASFNQDNMIRRFREGRQPQPGGRSKY